MNPNLVRRHFATSGKAQLAIRSSSTLLRRESHSQPAISSKFFFSAPPASTTRPALRRTISSSFFDPNAPKREMTNGNLFSLLMIFTGALVIGNEIDETYDIMGVWPKEVRNDLKVAVWAKQKQNLGAAAGYFERAYATAVLLPDPVASFGADYPIKISAIALSLAGVLESASDLPRAYSAYRTAFADLTRSLSHPSSSFTSIEADRRTRAIGIALKMVELGEQILRERALGRAPTDSKYGPVNEAEIEGKLDWALREALRMQNVSVKPSEKDEEKENAMLSLPTWAKGVTLASTMERAAEYYSRKGKLEYAAALYFLAISTLFPLPGQTPCDFFPFPSSPSTRDRCKAATLMNNLSSLFASATTVDTIPQATAWAEKALEVARTAKGESKAASEEHLECLRVISVLLSNLKKLKKGQTGKQPGQAQFIHELAVNMSKVSERRVEAHERVGRLRSQPPKP